ncbi:Tm-1-like ATP-binding domain-containing protein [Streptomyces sp. NBC_00893]|uniref:Tm-1-like ATP-binding domain-containing protein n=1 Tax=Streptomyces sp. NBC_00893 TaxID=2975862 RepID=UPI0022511BD7|nr:Tm-1-like ATP-binding domain-containing protein [Streptomyces sp. NBC_00893]MCX4849758.1 Tm-1-like ATP-binding domain-containing protein [Streptomyces sp. NBC_00893]
MATVVLVGTLDTKGPEYEWLSARLRESGCDVVLVDAGVMPSPVGTVTGDIDAAAVARRAGHGLEALRANGDRGAAVSAMADGVEQIVGDLYREGQLNAVLAVAGSGGSFIAARAMQALPIGVPKVLVSTMASGDVSPYVGSSDITMMYSVVDVAGINSVSTQIMGNAVAAAAGMAIHHERRLNESQPQGRPLIGASMFGVTTRAVDAARQRLDELGYEVLVFHATGAGGRALEKLAAGGFLAGVLDLTTTELADDLVGGVLSAGPDRLTAAGRAGLPQVVAPGALDMVNFGAVETVPERFAGRQFLEHNPTVTLMRTTADEMAELGASMGRKLASAHGPTAVLWPLGGVSAVDAPGGPFHDPEADAAGLASLRTALRGSAVDLREIGAHLNDASFAVAAADHLHQLISTQERSHPNV